MEALRWLGLLTFLWGLAALALSSVASEETPEERARRLLETYTSRVRPLEIAANRAWWNANLSGKDEDFKAKEEAQNRLDAVLADKALFQEVKAVRQAGGLRDPVLARAIEVIYRTMLEKQVDADLLRKITALANAVEQKFNTFRAQVAGRELSDAEVRKILKTSTDSKERRAVWEASKEVGKRVEKELHQLVQLRNQAARQLGFANYHALQLYVNEQDGNELLRLFDELDDLTRAPFLQAKADIDAALARRYGITPAELFPWHYHDPFFQEAPHVFPADLDAVYAQQDLVEICRRFYRGIGLPIDLVIEKTGDFAPHKGKNPHAFCIDLTRDGTDVRVLANVVPNEQWMSTLLHEFGHAVYSSLNIPPSVPYVLRQEAHILTTEGLAMMFERLSKRRAWVEQMGIPLSDPKAFEEAGRRTLRYQLLIFSRWCQVMFRFEKSMYENPEQDLSQLWWDLVERYQKLPRPPGRRAPDYGSKIHIVSAPAYYHNYLLGELFASQLHHAIAREVYRGAPPETVVYVGNPEVGRFLRQRVFALGRTVSWEELTRRATGAPLRATAFAEDFRSR
jgi:peptidyl-dipeptidase A